MLYFFSLACYLSWNLDHPYIPLMLHYRWKQNCRAIWLFVISYSEVLFMNLMFVDPCIIVGFIKKNPTRCNSVSKFYYSIFIWRLTCFGWHTTHHQEPKTALPASGFLYVEGCWTCSWWTLSGTVLCCQCSFSLLMMGDVSPETC